ncbi:MAG: Trp biosynthesis-associated membrane protein [Leucobacter sp.]
MRPKLLTLGGIAVAGGAALIAGSQTWVSFMLEGTHSLEQLTGHELNSALSPVAIAIVAAALALTIAGTVFRRVLGGLVFLLGAGLAALSLSVVSAPLGAVSGRLTELTGIVGGGSEAALSWIEVSAAGYVSVAAGVLAALLGIVAVVTGGKWAAAGRRYDSAPQRVDTSGDRISEWDALSEGHDPSEDIR